MGRSLTLPFRLLVHPPGFAALPGGHCPGHIMAHPGAAPVQKASSGGRERTGWRGKADLQKQAAEFSWALLDKQTSVTM